MTRVLEEILDYTRNWIRHINRMPCNRLKRLIRNYSQRQREPRKTIEETSGCVGTDRVNKWPDSMTDI
jgi:hypothetical protein